MTTPGQSAHVTALQAALAGEHAAAWASGRAAGELTGDRARSAVEQLDEHRAARDGLRRTIVALGATPVEAATAYREPFPVDGGDDARRLMVHVNERLAATYADLAAAAPTTGRRPAAAASTRAAVRAIGWGGRARAFPGEA